MLQAATFNQLIREASKQFGRRPLLADDEYLGPVSYDEALRFSVGFERELDRLNVPEGGAVATILHNCGLAALFFLATVASRRVFVPLNPLSTQDEASYMLDRAGCRVVFLDPAHTRVGAIPSIKTVAVTDHQRYFRQTTLQAAERVPVRLLNQPTPVFVGEVVYTSGSTGRPKGVVLSEYSLLANATSLALAYQLVATDRFLTICPLFHNSGQVFTTLSCVLVGGATVAVKSDVGMLNFWQYVMKYRAHWSLGMLSFLALLLSRGDGPEGPLEMKGLLTGGSTIDADLIQTFESKFAVPVRTVYGLTESASIATCEHRDPNPRSPGSSGRPLQSCDVRIAREDGELVMAGDRRSRAPGEIWVRGPTIFEGYVADPELTAMRKHDGWLKSGDLGYFDDDGNLFVIDRLDSMLIVGGENVYPAEVERLTFMLPGAAHVMLSGVDQPIWGKELVLVYSADPKVPVVLADWHRTLAATVAPFKLPQHYVRIEDLGFAGFPRMSNGKINRRAVALALQHYQPRGPVLHI